MVVFVAVSAAITCLNMVNQFGALLVATNHSYATALGADGSHAMVLLLMDLQHYGYLIAQLTWLWLFALGLLGYRSGMFPRWLSFLLMLGTVCYVIDALTPVPRPVVRGHLSGHLRRTGDRLRGVPAGLSAHQRGQDTTPHGSRPGPSLSHRAASPPPRSSHEAHRDSDRPSGRAIRRVGTAGGHRCRSGRWNPFITSLSGVFEVGERLAVRIAPVGGRPMTFKPRVTVVEPGRRLEWLGTMGIPGLFDGRHSFTLTPVEDGSTRLIQAEDFSGVLIPFTGKLLSRTKAGFEAMNAALLARLEKDQPTATAAGA